MSRTPTNSSGASAPQEFSDGRSYDPRAVRQITQQWIDMHMKNRESEFTKTTECSVFCGTWNVNAKKQEGSLTEWLLPPSSTPSDIYAVGFQEMVDLNALNVAINSQNTEKRAVFWQEKIRESLEQTRERYEFVGEKYLVGLYLVIFAREHLMPYIRDVRTTSLGVGIMGMMGNKGGVSVRLSVYDSTICFICAHLAAHRENVAGRNADFKNIYEKSVFVVENSMGVNSGAGAGASVSEEGITMPRQGAARYFDTTLFVPQHDLIFFMGDLNYRIDDTIPTEMVFAKCTPALLHTLLPHDQLNIERSKQRVFVGFDEGTINFLPTYKYQPNTDVYETRAEKKLRAPAWCDRVLFRYTHLINSAASASPAPPIRLVEYNRANLTPSDHKPVYASFGVSVKQVVEVKENSVYTELLGVLNRYTSKAIPVVEVEGLKIKLGSIEYEESKQSTLTISNKGESIAIWRLVDKLEDTRPCKRWVSFSATGGLLLPGEVATVTVTCTVDTLTAQELSAGKDLLQDLVVLRIERSVDYYVDISADYVCSCFGMSLDDLCSQIQPVSQKILYAQNPEALLNKLDSADANTPPATTLSIPKEVWRLVDALVSGGALKEKDLFQASPSPAEVLAVRKALDQGLDFPAHLTPHVYVEVLVRLLAALPTPLLPPHLYPQSDIDDKVIQSASRKLLEDLGATTPITHYNTFVYVVSFLREVLVEEMYNRCTPALLTGVCVQCMTGGMGGGYERGDDGLGQGEDHARMFLSKDAKAKREARLGYLQKILLHLLTTASL